VSPRRPGVVLAAGALLAGTVTAATAGPVSVPSLAGSAAGIVALAAGVTRNRRRVAALGTLALLGAVLAAGLANATPGRLLPATAGALLAWEFATAAFAARRELAGGTVAGTELLHVGAAAGVGALVVAAGVGLYRTLTVGVSVVGTGLLLIAAVALALAIGARE